MWIEKLPLGVNRRQTRAAEHLQKFAVNQLHPVIELRRHLRVAMLQGALEAVERGQERPDQIGGGVLDELLLLALGALAKILQLSLLAKKAVVEILLLGEELLVSPGEILGQSGFAARWRLGGRFGPVAGSPRSAGRARARNSTFLLV